MAEQAEPRLEGVEVLGGHDGLATYSQIGSRGEPWTAVSSPSLRTSGSVARYERALSPSAPAVHSMAARASGLKYAGSTMPIAAPSWLPITLRAPISWRVAMTSFGCGPYPTVSPRTQTWSTGGGRRPPPRGQAGWHGCPRGQRCACEGRVYRGSRAARAERTPARLAGAARVAMPASAVLRDHHEPMVAELVEARSAGPVARRRRALPRRSPARSSSAEIGPFQATSVPPTGSSGSAYSTSTGRVAQARAATRSWDSRWSRSWPRTSARSAITATLSVPRRRRSRAAGRPSCRPSRPASTSLGGRGRARCPGRHRPSQGRGGRGAPSHRAGAARSARRGGGGAPPRRAQRCASG